MGALTAASRWGCNTVGRPTLKGGTTPHRVNAATSWETKIKHDSHVHGAVSKPDLRQIVRWCGSRTCWRPLGTPSITNHLSVDLFPVHLSLVCLICFCLAGLGLVLVLYQYEYQGRDGVPVSIKPNERYVLLAKTNDHWWQVCEDNSSKPFYIPAKYVKELPPDVPSPLDFADPPQPEPVLLPVAVPVPVPVPVVKPLEEPPGTKVKAGDEVTIRLRPDTSSGYRKFENRMSTFGVPLDLQDPLPLLVQRNPMNLPPGAVESSTTSSSSRTTNLTDNGLKHLGGFFEDGRDSPSNPRTQTQAIPVDTPVVPSLGDLHNQGQDPQEPVIEPEDAKPENVEEESVKDEESNHIYESIQDLNLDLDTLLPDRNGPGTTADPAAPAPTQVRPVSDELFVSLCWTVGVSGLVSMIPEQTTTCLSSFFALSCLN